MDTNYIHSPREGYHRHTSTSSLPDSSGVAAADPDDLDAQHQRDTSASLDTWTFRSTIGAFSDDDYSDESDSDDDDSSNAIDSSGDNEQSGSDDERGSNDNAHRTATDDSNSAERLDSHIHRVPQLSVSVSVDTDLHSSSNNSNQTDAVEIRKPALAPKLLSIPGFSNSEALKARLPVRRLAPTPTSIESNLGSGKHAKLPPHALKHKHKLDRLQQQDATVITNSRRDGASDRLALKKRAQLHSNNVRIGASHSNDDDDDVFQGKRLEHKIAMHDDRTRRDAMTAKTTRRSHGRSLLPQLDAPATARAHNAYSMSSRMVCAIAFTSAATLHCALFNFSVELRRLLHIDTVPIGVFVLVSWAMIGFVSAAGSWLGDAVRDRVVLLRRAAAGCGLAVLLLHFAAFRTGSTLSSVLLAIALPGSCIAHGVLAPNCVVLGAQKFAPVHDRRCRPPQQRHYDTQRPRRHLQHASLSNQGSSSSSALDEGALARKLERAMSLEHVRSIATDTDAQSIAAAAGDHHDRDSNADDDYTIRMQQLSAARSRALHAYYSRCFGASLAGSTCVQLLFFLVVDVDALLPSPSPTSSLLLLEAPTRLSGMTRRGFLAMLLASVLLLATLICFAFHARHHHTTATASTAAASPHTRAMHALERKLQRHEQLERDAFSWRAVVRICSHTVVGNALLLAIVLAIAGVCIALVVLLVVPAAAFNVRLAAFLLIAIGWSVATSISRYQLCASGKLFAICLRLNVPTQQLDSALLLAFFVCMSVFATFLRAQLYTTLVAQVCQTRLALAEGTTSAVVNPNAIGALGSIVSLVLVLLANASLLRTSRNGAVTTTKRSLTALSPARRLSIGIFLYLVGIFLASVVELYRRRKAIETELQSTKCNKAHSDFGVLWTLPHLVFLGLADMVFRVSLHEQLHAIRLLSTRYPGFVQGTIELSEMLGNVGALALSSALSEWLFRPSTSDMAVVLLLMTTLLAFSYSSLKRIAQKMTAGQLRRSDVDGRVGHAQADE